jgi:hypothetical protein
LYRLLHSGPRRNQGKRERGREGGREGAAVVGDDGGVAGFFFGEVGEFLREGGREGGREGWISRSQGVWRKREEGREGE